MEKQTAKDFLNDLIASSIKQVSELAKTNTVVGEMITINNASIIPISKVSVGFVSGGGEYSPLNKKQNYPSIAGSSGGVSITPIGFISIVNKDVKFIDIQNKVDYEKILNVVNNFVKIKKKDESDEN